MDLATYLSLPVRSFATDVGTVAAVEVGSGPSLALFHGNSTWSYQWRDVIPPLAGHFRCFGPDLLGFGRSDRLHHYDWDTHLLAVRAVVEQVGPSILVGHDWGGAFTTAVALLRPDLVRGLVLMEAQLVPESWDDYVDDRRRRFEELRDPTRSSQLIDLDNVMVEQLPANIVRALTDEELNGYRYPCPSPVDRIPMRRFVEMKPIGDDSETASAFQWLANGLSDLSMPVLLLAVQPGALIGEARARWLEREIPKLEIRRLGHGRHHLQEDHATGIAEHILAWATENDLL